MRALTAAAAILLAGCSSTTGAPAGSPPSHPSVLAVGCTEYPVLSGTQPQWLEDAGAGNNPAGLPYVISKPAIAAGFLFGFPLRAGHPVEPSNKILWVVRKPRDGYPLIVTGHPADASAPIVNDTFPDNAGPGEIYPSGIDVPSAGCWDFTLRWAGNTSRVDLDYA